MKLSILTPACWERLDKCRELRECLAAQIAKQPKGTVEHLVLFDNRTRSVGLKRQALIDSALGEYIAFVDDDDTVSPDYIEALIIATASKADVITFEQDCYVNGKHGKVVLKLGQKDEVWKPGRITKRNAWQINAWRREIAKQCMFPDLMDGEDLSWSRQMRIHAKTSHHIPRILHTYRFDSSETFATGKTAPEN